MEAKNQLFIHPTNACNLGCKFCVYEQSRKSGICSTLDLNKGNASINLERLIKGAQHTAFSGGGEPLLNINAIISCIKLNKNKKYMITTGLGISIKELQYCIDLVNKACQETDSLCVLRISIDSFHKNLDFDDKIDTIIKWFINKNWERVRVCFIRGTVAEGRMLLKNLKKYCLRNFLPFICKKVNQYTYAFIIKGRFFQVILRPTIYPSSEELRKEQLMLDYIDTMLKIDTEEIYLGKPRSCRGCKGCDSWKSGLPNGLDITVNADGDITLYGAELCILGNIYKDNITYELLNERVNDCPQLIKIQSVGIRDVMEAFLNDPELGALAKKINYPFAVIRECMRDHREDVYRIIDNL